MNEILNVVLPILIPFAVIAGIALVLGVLLAVISHFFSVPEDPTYRQIRDCLPGVNCGACGYTGCDDYANALAGGTEKRAGLCIPGTKVVAEQIGGILGVEADDTFVDLVAFVSCNGHCDAAKDKATYEGVNSCVAAARLYGGPSACNYGCLGYGDCAGVCPANAICTIDGVAHVDTSRCLGCGLCVKTCPKSIISMLPQEAAITVMCNSKAKGADARKACQNACIGCKKCEKTCPQGAISVADNLAAIDYTKCTGCGACVDACPTGCLKKVCFPNVPEGVTAEDLME